MTRAYGSGSSSQIQQDIKFLMTRTVRPWKSGRLRGRMGIRGTGLPEATYECHTKMPFMKSTSL
eukprot:scaffold649798_cov51-Prasinocladus_malaysianus.AAC.1